MADDEEEVELDEEIDGADAVVEPDDDDIDGDDIDGEFADGDLLVDADFVEGAEDVPEVDDDESDDAAPAPAAAADEDDDDEPDPDDVEEDLDKILKDRLVSGDDLDEEEDEEVDEEVAPPIQATEGDKVAPKGDNEWTCTGCFLIVSARQFGQKSTATCPSGESNCPSLLLL